MSAGFEEDGLESYTLGSLVASSAPKGADGSHFEEKFAGNERDHNFKSQYIDRTGLIASVQFSTLQRSTGPMYSFIFLRHALHEVIAGLALQRTRGNNSVYNITLICPEIIQAEPTDE